MKRASVLLLLALPLVARAYSNGPPDGVTGAPDEVNCTVCHTSFEVNSGDGSLVISGPASYQAGQSYPITVTLQDPGQQRWGFELTTQGVGLFTITDPQRTQVEQSFLYQYVKHTQEGTHAGFFDGPNSWTFTWTAPAQPAGTIWLYAAGNASNDSGDDQGDYIYTTSLGIPPTLEAVADLAIMMVGGDAHLDWTPVAGAAQYRVERSPQGYGPWQSLALTTTPHWQDAAPGTAAYYRVVALQ